MKTSILFTFLSVGIACAEFEKWTSREGKTADLELIKVTETGGEKAGEFKKRDGKLVTLRACELSKADAARMARWQAAVETGKEEKALIDPSPFDPFLKDNLLKVDGDGLVPCEPAPQPKEYYVFLIVLSGDSQIAWTNTFMSLCAKFYKENKSEKFEFFHIPYVPRAFRKDQSKRETESILIKHQTPWPILKTQKCEKLLDYLAKTPKEGYMKEESKQGAAEHAAGYPQFHVFDSKGKFVRLFHMDVTHNDFAEFKKLIE